ncbi:MAG TPA: chemotaxis protein CheD, partial [Azospira sp.]|nr:chemotaxis protein CheD [Azospira sp.]
DRLARVVRPGGWSVATDLPVSTLLGSCVAVCLFDPQLKIGGMNHFLLPSRGKDKELDADTILSGDYSMEVLVNALLGKGAQKRRLVAKMFGGGTIVSCISMAIGERNVEFAREWLGREGITVAAADVLGAWSRKVVFVPTTGDAFCQRLPVTQAIAVQVSKEEEAYAQTLVRPAANKGIELF